MTTTTVRRAQLELARIRRATVAESLRLWSVAGGVSAADLEAFVDAVLPVVQAGQQLTADVTAAYLGDMLERPVGSPPIGALELRAGVDVAEVYARPVVTARTGLSQGKPWATAMREAAARLEQLAATDVQLAHRATAREVFGGDQRVVGYRRVLSGSSCALCAVASTQRYRTDELLPIHSHCDCTVAPIVGDRDPGQVINSDLLRDLRAEGGPSYWNDRGLRVEDGRVIRVADERPLEVTQHTHGELGPVIADAEHAFATL